MEHEVVNEVTNGIVNAAVNPGYDLGHITLGVVGIPIALVAGYYGLRELYRAKFQQKINPGAYHFRKEAPQVISAAAICNKKTMESLSTSEEITSTLMGAGNVEAGINNRRIRRAKRDLVDDIVYYKEKMDEL